VDAEAPLRRGPPPLAPFGLVLRHDGRWVHEGEPFRNRKLRELFDRSVRYLPEERKFVVQVQRFRGEIEVEEAGFFVRAFDSERGAVALSDRSEEALDVASLAVSALDGALLCRVKCDLVPGGLLARFSHAAHAELMNAIETDSPESGQAGLRIAGEWVALPDL
jgi:hypothetical protein